MNQAQSHVARGTAKDATAVRCPFSQPTFAGMRGNEEDAPRAGIRGSGPRRFTRSGLVTHRNIGSS